MKILVLHNRYQQPGGEDVVAEKETALLQQAGHQVHLHTVNNDGINSIVDKTRTAIASVWNPASRKRLDRILDTFTPDVIHIHNLFPQWSGSVIHYAAKRNIPTVMTLHNYRLLCPSATLFFEGKPFLNTLEKRSQWDAVQQRVYRGSFAGTAAIAAANHLHRKLGTYTKTLNRLLFLTPFQRDLFLDQWPEVSRERCVVKGNFAEDPGDPPPFETRSGFLFVGRLSQEKGIHSLLQIAKATGIPLTICGDGPLKQEVETACRNIPSLKFRGRISPEEIRFEMRQAEQLLFPSRWYEGFPLTLVEAMANGLPVLASHLGSMPDIIDSGKTGLLFSPDKPDEWIQHLRSPVNSQELAIRGANARQEYLTHYTPEASCKKLEEVYLSVCA